MGQGAVAITRDEFLTPPEFRDRASTYHPSARVGGGRIELIRTPAGRTRLGTCYQQIPLKVMPPLELDAEPASLLYLVNLTAGLLDGDAHLVQVTARDGTRAVVTGQSATRVHPALASYATQQWEVSAGEGSCLVVLPGPTIPYRGCRYHQRGRLELAPTARVLWGDVWLAGRYDRVGVDRERFVFDRIVQDFEARRGGRLVYRDRFRWDGPWTGEEADWYFSGQLAAASLFVGGPLPDPWPAELADPGEGVRRAVFPLDTGEACVRWCGPPTAVTADLVRVAFRLAAHWTGGPAAPPWLSSGELTPNHWFSA